jgi:outer membrane cobalamin receptor
MQHAKWVLAAAALTAAATATAQDQDASGGLEEITVTAQRREQSLQDVPIAITAFTADQLEQRQVFNTYDLVRNIPNLTGNSNVGVGTSSSLYIGWYVRRRCIRRSPEPQQLQPVRRRAHRSAARSAGHPVRS